MSETVSAGQLRKILEESRCQPNHGCNVANTCMCALAEDAIDALEAALAAPSPAPAAPAPTDLEEWIERNFSGHGRALRERWEPPLPDEPYMSMDDAKALTRRAVAEFAAQPRSPEQAAELEQAQRSRDAWIDANAAAGQELVRLSGEVERLREALRKIADGANNVWQRGVARAALAASPVPGAIADGEAGCKCHGCGAIYRVDINVSDALWKKIARGDRLLCGRCICSRIEAMGEFGAFNLAAECPHTDIDFSRQCYACGEIVPGPGAGGEWKPMSTVPKDGKQVLIESTLNGEPYYFIVPRWHDDFLIDHDCKRWMRPWLAAAPQQGGDNAG